MSASWAKVGAKCVCVDAKQTLGPDVLIEGAVYEIAAVFSARINSVRRGYGEHLLLALVGESNPYSLNGGWMPERFRPLITQEDDVRLIKSLLLEDAGLVPAGVELDA
jgi:hypothetical protein